MFFCSTKTERPLYSQRLKEGDWLVFGNEGHGLPPHFYEQYRDNLWTLPMPGEHCRSLNLANSVAVVLYEALRQQGFPGLEGAGRLREARPEGDAWADYI